MLARLKSNPFLGEIRVTYPGAPERPQPRFIPAAEPPARSTIAHPQMPGARHRRRRPRRKSHRLPWTLLAVAAFGVGMAAVAAYKGDLSVGTLTGETAKPLTCRQQYAKWRTGPALADSKKIAAELNGVQNANDDIVTISNGLRQAGGAAGQLVAYPMPACADPGGYWRQTLADVKASGDNAGTASGLVGLIAAEVPLKNVPALETKLQAELKTTTK